MPVTDPFDFNFHVIGAGPNPPSLQLSPHHEREPQPPQRLRLPYQNAELDGRLHSMLGGLTDPIKSRQASLGSPVSPNYTKIIASMKLTQYISVFACGVALTHVAASAPNVHATSSIRTPTTGNTTAPSEWRFAPGQAFNGVAGALDGVARLSFTNSGGNWACSGSLLQGGKYVLTAAHCADNFTSMKVEFGYYNGAAQVTRTVATNQAFVHSGWTGELDTGADIAILKLDTPVTTISGYKISTTNDVGKQYLMAGYGATQSAASNSNTNWSDGQYGHYGYNVFDVTSKIWNTTIFTDDPVYGVPEYYKHGATYMSDFDRSGAGSTAAQRANFNVLGRTALDFGGTWTSDEGLGSNEALSAGGDSGGGAFIFDGGEWVLSAVQSWGWDNPCAYFDYGSCNTLSGNPSGYGDLAGATATFSHVEWIDSVVSAAPVPESESYLLVLAGLGVVGSVIRRRT